MNNLEPRGVGRRVMSALALLVAVSFSTHLVYEWLAPMVPTATGVIGAVVVVGSVYRLMVQRRWWQ